jgi:hypothetical protein
MPQHCVVAKRILQGFAQGRQHVWVLVRVYADPRTQMGGWFEKRSRLMSPCTQCPPSSWQLSGQSVKRAGALY